MICPIMYNMLNAYTQLYALLKINSKKIKIDIFSYIHKNN